MPTKIADAVQAMKWWNSLSPQEILKHRKKVGVGVDKITTYWLKLNKPIPQTKSN